MRFNIMNDLLSDNYVVMIIIEIDAIVVEIDFDNKSEFEE